MFAHEDGGPEPDWVRTERDQFSDFRDLNKDGKMDQEEIQHWILPQDYDHAQAEARHLVYESDTDKVLLTTLCNAESACGQCLASDTKISSSSYLKGWFHFVELWV